MILKVRVKVAEVLADYTGNVKPALAALRQLTAAIRKQGFCSTGQDYPITDEKGAEIGYGGFYRED